MFGMIGLHCFVNGVLGFPLGYLLATPCKTGSLILPHVWGYPIVAAIDVHVLLVGQAGSVGSDIPKRTIGNAEHTSAGIAEVEREAALFHCIK